MNELGLAEPHVIEAILGHTLRGVQAVYNRAKHEAAKRVALELWGAHVNRLRKRDSSRSLKMRRMKLSLLDHLLAVDRP